MGTEATLELRAQQDDREGLSSRRPFSLWLYLLIVFGLSWPFQVVAAIWGLDLLPRYTLHSISMCMVSVGTFIAGRYVFRDGFAGAGWKWGRAKHYLAVAALVLLMWAAPMLLDMAFGALEWPDWTVGESIWVGVFLINFIPGFGEEFGWRGYLLPRLAARHAPRKAVLIHSVIWWLWHLPILAGVGVWAGKMGAEQAHLPVIVAAVVSAFAVVIASAIPAMLHGVIFAYLWTWSGSLAVVTFYHLLYDGVRDSIQSFLGSGSASGLWPMGVIVLLGAILLRKGNWENLRRFKDEKENIMAAEAG